MLERLTSIYIALLLTVFLLAFPGGGYTAIAEFKYNLFILVCGGYVLTIAILRIMYVITGIKPAGNIGEVIKKIPTPSKFLFIFLFFTALSSLFSQHSGTFYGTFRQEGFFTISIYILSCVFVSVYFRPKKWMLFLLGFSLSASSFIALVQLTGANPFLLYPEGYNFYGSGIHYSGAYLSTAGNSGLFAGFLTLTVGLLAMALVKFDFKEKWFLGLPLFLGVLLIFEMDINAAVLALAAGIVFMLPVAVTCQRTLANTLAILTLILGAFTLSQVLVFQDGPILFVRIRFVFIAAVIFMLVSVLFVKKYDMFSKISVKWYRIGTAAVMLSIICAVLGYIWLYSEDSGTVYEASQVMRGNWDNQFGTHRIYIWRNIIENIRRDLLLLGTGPDTIGHWPILPFTRYTEDGILLVSIIDAAHNEFLHIFATGGLLSLLAYLTALLTAVVSWLRYPQNALSAVAGTGVLFYTLQSVFGISQFITAPFFWACFGVLLYSHTTGGLTC